MFYTQDDFIRWWSAYSVPWHEVPRWMILALTIMLVYVLFPWGRRTKKMGRASGWKEQFSDIITDAIEQAIHKGKITRKTGSRAYRECANKLGLDDLRPKSLIFKAGTEKMAWVKKQIRKRIKGDVNAVVALPLPDLGPVVYKAPAVRKKLKI